MYRLTITILSEEQLKPYSIFLFYLIHLSGNHSSLAEYLQLDF